MSEDRERLYQSWERQDPWPARRARIAEVAKEVMNGYNQSVTDPSVMAVNGHDTELGYEFFVERDGRTIRFTAQLEE